MLSLIRRSVFFMFSLVLFSVALTSVAAGEEQRDRQYDLWLSRRPLISAIEIEGNNSFSDGKVKSRLFAQKNSFLHLFRSGSRNRVLRYTADRDTAEAKYLYLREGFLNIRVQEEYRLRPKDSSAIVVVTISEGERFLLSNVAIRGNSELSFFPDLIKQGNDLKSGGPIDPFAINDILFRLKTIYANNGYPYASVDFSLDSSAGPAQTAITFDTRENQLVHFGRVEINDLQRYSPYLARREFAFKEGEIYRRKKIIDSQRRLYATGLFHSINLDTRRPDSSAAVSDSLDTTPDFIFTAIERKPQFISVKTGAGQDPQQDLIWDFSLGWGKRNIFVSRRFETSFSSRYVILPEWRPLYHRYQVRYTEPWFLNIRMPLTLTGRFEPGVRSLLQDYSIQKWGVALSTRKEWSEQLYAVISGEYENVNIYGVSIDKAAVIRSEENISVRRKLTGNLIRDARRNRFMPASGSLTSYYAQFVGGVLGGDDDFIKLEFSWARYQQAYGRTVYATRVKGGWVKELGDSRSVPTDDRFYLGGANSIRGFRENSIGPRAEDGTNNGANAYVIFNQEIRLPLFWKVWGSIFTDLGNGWASFAKARPEDLLFSYGAGVQFISPAGPLRFDYARRVENAGYSTGDRLHVTILYAF